MAASQTDRAYDVVVYGASGFTGRLVAQHLVKTYGVGGDVRWAMAGRSRTRLEAVCTEIGAPDGLPLILADAAKPDTLLAMGRQTKAVISTVGPYQLYGEPLVAACAEAGTDYVDLCGEPAWMALMIAKYDAKAKASGARIVFSCGFDSIPFDLGAYFLQREARARLGAPLSRVRGRVRSMKGGMSGGTLASGMATMQAIKRDPSIAKVLADPFALTLGFRGPPQPAGDQAVYDDVANAWAAPFIMAEINTKNVHRTNFLLGHPFGKDFVYDEMMLTGDGPKGRSRAKTVAGGSRLAMGLMAFGPTRAVLRLFLPKPGEGPTLAQREAGSYNVSLSGETADGRQLRAVVTGDKDPGYGSTSRMIGEAGLCIAEDVSREQTPGGVWTAGAAMADALIARLEAQAGLRFSLEN
jgi:short subunit dehydrogenase-like uncharacterized protein